MRVCPAFLRIKKPKGFTWEFFCKESDRRHGVKSKYGTSCDELKELGSWKSRSREDRYAKFATKHLAAAASRIESDRGGNVVQLSRFSHVQNKAA